MIFDYQLFNLIALALLTLLGLLQALALHRVGAPTRLAPRTAPNQPFVAPSSAMNDGAGDGASSRTPRKRLTEPTKRATGTVSKLAQDRWQVRVEIGRDGTGKRHRLTRNVRGTREDAERARLVLLNEVLNGTAASRRAPRTLNDLYTEWMAYEINVGEDKGLRPRTVADYSRRYLTYVAPELGRRRIADLTLDDMYEFRRRLAARRKTPRLLTSVSAINRAIDRGQPPAMEMVEKPVRDKLIMRAKKRPDRKHRIVELWERAERGDVRLRQFRAEPLSTKTVNGALKVLRMLMRYGLKRNYVRIDLTFGLKGFKGMKREVQALTEEQLFDFLEAAQDSYYYPLILLIATTGCRPSEAAGLTWSDISFSEGVMRIRRSLLDPSSDDPLEDRVKSFDSVREIPLPAFVLDVLKEQRAWQSKCGLRHPHDLVFTSVTGRPVDTRNLLNNHVKPIAARAGIDPAMMTTYVLRHTFATHFLQNDFGSLEELRKLLGHSSVRTSIDNYVHADKKGLRRSMDRAGERLKGGLKRVKWAGRSTN